MNFTRKHRIVVSLAAVAVIGAGIYAGTRPFSVSHAPTNLAVADNPPPPPPDNTAANGGTTFSEGNCTGTAGQENLLTNPSAGDNAPFTITYGDEWAPTCYVWSVDGTVVSENDSPSQQTTQTLSWNANSGQTVSLFAVDGDHGGNWDMYTWSPTGNNSKTVVFSSSCSASAGPEKLIFSPSQYGVPVSGGVGVSAKYSDETILGCHVWILNGKIDTADDCTTSPNTTNETLCFRFPAAGDHFTITLDVADTDHGSNWDQYTWTQPGCYPPNDNNSFLQNVSANQGNVTGTLTYKCTPVGNGHLVTETDHNGHVQTNKTNNSGVFNFGPGNVTFPVTINHPDDTVNGDHVPASSNMPVCAASANPKPTESCQPS